MTQDYDTAEEITTAALTIDSSGFDELRAQLIVAADAMAMAMVAFTDLLAKAEVLIGEGTDALAAEPAIQITPGLEVCMQECMLGDLDCVSACIEQAKITTA